MSEYSQIQAKLINALNRKVVKHKTIYKLDNNIILINGKDKCYYTIHRIGNTNMGILIPSNMDNTKANCWYIVGKNLFDGGENPDIPGYVNLGLPSGTLWATKNVGANTPSETGLYFEFGEIQGYYTEQIGVDKQFASDYSDYKYARDGKFTKYCTNAAYGYNGFTDGLTTLLPEDDAATQMFGIEYHVPSKEQAQELLNNTTSQMTTLNGISGCLFTSIIEGYTDKSIFIPACGNGANGSIANPQYIYCSLDYTLYDRYYYRYCIFAGSGYSAKIGSARRHYGMTIRPVYLKN